MTGERKRKSTNGKIEITLKLRPSNDTLSIPITWAHGVLSRQDRNQIDQFAQIVANASNGRHDVEWLKMIVNWTPEGGLPVTEMVRWFSLAAKLNDMETDKDVDLEISERTIDAIYERLADERFKLTSTNPLFAAFMLDFARACGRPLEELLDE